MNVKKTVTGFGLFLSAILITAYWIRVFGLPAEIFYISCLIAAFIIAKKFTLLENKTSKMLFIPAIIITLVLSSQMLYFGYTGSNDGLHSILVDLIRENEKIPLSYAPFADLSFSYTAAFHSLVSFIPFGEAFVLNWVAGLISVFLAVLLFTFIIEKKTNAFIASCSVLLLLGTKMIFLDFFYGLYPRLFGLLFIILSVYLISKKSRLWIVPVIGLFVIHPAYSVAGFLWIILELWRTNQLKRALYFALVPIFGAVAIIQSYLVYLGNIGSQVSGNFTFGAIVPLALLYGLPLIIAMLTAVVYFTKKSNFGIENMFRQKESVYYLIIFLVFVFFSYITSPFLVINKGFISAGSLLAIIFISIQIRESNILGWLEKHLKIKNAPVFFMIMVLIFASTNIFISGDIKERMLGSKINPKEAEFAFSFAKIDPSLDTVLFITRHGGKMAEYSKKIPYNVMDSYFLPYDESQVINNSDFNAVLHKKVIDDSIRSDCEKGIAPSIIYDLNTKYIVQDENKYHCKINLDSILNVNGIVLYEKK